MLLVSERVFSTIFFFKACKVTTPSHICKRKYRPDLTPPKNSINSGSVYLKLGEFFSNFLGSISHGVAGKNAVALPTKSEYIDCISHDQNMSQMVLSGCDTQNLSLEGIGSDWELLHRFLLACGTETSTHLASTRLQ